MPRGLGSKGGSNRDVTTFRMMHAESCPSEGGSFSSLHCMVEGGESNVLNFRVEAYPGKYCLIYFISESSGDFSTGEFSSNAQNE